MALLTLTGVRKIYPSADGAAAGLQHIDLDIEEGELVTLLGPSGCGKTTTLRCIAGLETPDQGTITLDGRTLFAAEGGQRPTVKVPPEKRGLAMVFQNYALWPHMSVFDNVAFGLRSKKLGKSEIRDKVETALRNVQLWNLRDRRISQLSGGQQQRIAVARAMAPQPKVVLFDEPLSNIDSQLRESMRVEILDLQQRMGLTSVWVTHDQQEALGMSSRIVLMNGGQVEQVDTPERIWNHPQTEFGAAFIGASSALEATVQSTNGSGTVVRAPGEIDITLAEPLSAPAGAPVTLYIRPGAVSIVEDESSSTNVWRVPVEVESFHGDYTLIVVRLGESRLSFRTTRPRSARTDTVQLHLDASDVLAFVQEQEQEQVR